MKGYYPGPEGVLGASECAVGLDAELGSTPSTPVWQRLTVGWPGDIVRVALWTVNTVGPSLSNKPGFRQAFVLVTLKSVKQRPVYRSGMIALGGGLKQFVPVFGRS